MLIIVMYNLIMTLISLNADNLTPWWKKLLFDILTSLTAWCSCRDWMGLEPGKACLVPPQWGRLGSLSKGNRLPSLGCCSCWVWGPTGTAAYVWSGAKGRWSPTPWPYGTAIDIVPFLHSAGDEGVFLSPGLAHPLFSGPCSLLCSRWVFLFVFHLFHATHNNHPSSLNGSELLIAFPCISKLMGRSNGIKILLLTGSHSEHVF